MDVIALIAMTDTNESNEAIIRADRRGRLRYTKEQKEALLAAYRDSGLSGPQFAAMHGIKYPTLASWLQNRGRSEAASRPDAGGEAPRLFLAELNGTGTSALEVRLPGGATLMIHSREQAALAVMLLRELQPRVSC